MNNNRYSKKSSKNFFESLKTLLQRVANKNQADELSCGRGKLKKGCFIQNLVPNLLLRDSSQLRSILAFLPVNSIRNPWSIRLSVKLIKNKNNEKQSFKQKLL